MKDEDFDTLGKRLYDLEADPPEDGWKKLRPVLATTPAAKSGWVRRNGWKALFFALPVLLYSVYYVSSLEAPTSMAGNSDIEARKKKDLNSALTKEDSKPNQPDQIIRKNQNDRASINSAFSSVENLRSKNGKSKQADLSVKEQTQTIEDINSQPASEKGEGAAAYIRNVSSEPKNGVIASETFESDEKETANAIVQSRNKVDIDSVEMMAEEILLETKGEELDTVSQVVTEEKEDKRIREWRMSASFAPAFQTHSARPVLDDDVYITDVDNSTPFKQTGYGFSLGVGRSLSSNFYLDAQLSYTKVKQDIFYTFATGKVDTLLAIQQADNSVLIKPVYEVRDQELRTRYHYGGLRVMATYYFWSRQTSRFNLSTAVGAHYQLASTVEENQAGQWNEISIEPAGRMNYSFMIAAGYNLKVGNGWEFMINPTLSYFLREVKVKNVPYSLNQQSIGINLLVSKTLFNKE